MYLSFWPLVEYLRELPFALIYPCRTVALLEFFRVLFWPDRRKTRYLQTPKGDRVGDYGARRSPPPLRPLLLVGEIAFEKSWKNQMCQGPKLKVWGSTFRFEVFFSGLHHIYIFLYECRRAGPYWWTATTCILRVVMLKLYLRNSDGFVGAPL